MNDDQFPAFKTSVRKFTVDDTGEVTLILKVSPQDAPKALGVAVMREIVFLTKFTPDSVESRAQSL